MAPKKEIAKYACDKLELGAEEGQEVSTLKGYLKGVKKQKVKDRQSDMRLARGVRVSMARSRSRALGWASNTLGPKSGAA